MIIAHILGPYRINIDTTRQFDKDGYGKPIYTFDLRDPLRTTDVLISNESGGRAQLNLNSQVTFLIKPNIFF